MYNEEEEKKIEEVSAKIELRDDFSSTLDDLKDETSKENNNFAVEKLITDSDQFVDSMDREIILEGAPYVLKSKDEDDDLKIYGAEKQETRDEAAGIVRKYMYLQDAQSKSNSLFRNSLSRNNESVNIGTAASLSSMLGQNSGDSNANLKSEFELVEKLSQYLGGDDLRFLVSKLGGIYEQISNLDEVRQSGDAKYLPSRDDNPYLSVSAKEKAKMMEETKQEINDCVIDQRNIDVADIFTDIIKDSDEKIGIIQFGRGHTEGLVEELNKQGISVTVITPAKIM